MLFFRIAVLKTDYAVEYALVLGILAVVAVTDKLEFFACLCLCKRGLYLCTLDNGKRFGIEIIVVGLVLGDRVYVFNGKQLVRLSHPLNA